jgi:putative glutamine amidotransferase
MTACLPKPLVLVPACNRQLGDHPFHIAGQKYVDAVRLAGCTPLIVPTAEADEIPGLLALADGVLLTGSPSNVHPSHFGEDVHDPSLPLDPARDAWTLPLIRQALALGLPLFAICRGTQETNVALGGSLHQAVQEWGRSRTTARSAASRPQCSTPTCTRCRCCRAAGWRRSSGAAASR